MPTPHDKLIATAAKELLGPLGFQRKGRSRVWLADHGWWLTVVEFQPSGWTKGSYLNVAAHWLWLERVCLSFDYGGRIEPFSEYTSDAQFRSEAAGMAQVAAEEAKRLHLVFHSVEAAATTLAARESNLADQGKGSWSTYHAGMAMGLSGRLDDAAILFRSIVDDRVRPAVARIGSLLSDPIGFRQEADRLIAGHREALGLPSTSLMSALS